jgi:response regulator NasT
VTKPIHARELAMAIDFSHIAQSRIKMMINENKKLQKKLNEVKFINHAKILLVQYEQLTEEEAHKKIERRAMDERVSRVVVAKDIIDRYE